MVGVHCTAHAKFANIFLYTLRENWHIRACLYLFEESFDDKKCYFKIKHYSLFNVLGIKFREQHKNYKQ